MEMLQPIRAYFEAAAGDASRVDDYFAEDIRIEDTGEKEIIKGSDNCKKWLNDISRQYELETEFADVRDEGNGTIKVSAIVTGNFASEGYPFDYYFSILGGKIKKVKIIYMGR